MRAITAETLLGVWEQAEGQPPVHQALALLAAAFPEVPAERLAALSLGTRDAHLLALRAHLFGPALTALAACPQCQEPVEVAFDVDDLHPMATTPPEKNTLEAEGYTVHYRVPNSLDAIAAGACESVEAARQRLLARCVLEATQDSTPTNPGTLPEHVQTALARQMAHDDPLAEVLLDLQCPACEHTWQALFDVIVFLWAEIEAWAVRLLREVHVLARAYGWAEPAILSMPARRRQRYLALLSA